MKNSLKKLLIFSLILSSQLSVNNIFAKENKDLQNINTKNININEINTKKLNKKEIIEEMIKDGTSRADAERLVNENSISNSVNYGSYYTTYEKQLNVSKNYKPTLKFYLQIEYGHGMAMIKSLKNVNIVREFNGISKSFVGEIYCNVENYQTIYYEINGDFYNEGITETKGKINLKIGEDSTILFNVDNPYGYFNYIYESEKIYIR